MFPEKWQQDYLKSGQHYNDDDIEQSVVYMNLAKGIADEDDEKRGTKCRSNLLSRNCSRVSGNRFNYNQQDMIFCVMVL